MDQGIFKFIAPRYEMCLKKGKQQTRETEYAFEGNI